ncbi:hypothetical protein [Haloarchaeobius sp. HRN-SO-5]|uniref:hypothetical protein n=1 Tax=Haloarchaeobius sp. HRN-SO-5 TaxID=3446118 RepID=UPI003EBBAF57
MSSDTFAPRLGPQRVALLGAVGCALSLVVVSQFVPTGSTIYWAVLALVSVDFAVAYLVLKRVFEQQR